MKYKVLGISSGLGVSLFPFREQLIGNVEPRGIFHTPGNDQWKLNFGEIPIHKNPWAAHEMEIPDLDILISSPDCGSGSILRYSRAKKLGDHTKNLSLGLFFVGVKKHKPKLFLFENLDGLFKSFPKERFVDLLRDYRLVEHTASVAHWGNSQKNRKRLVIVGIRRDLPKTIDKYFRLPKYKEPKTCRQLYGNVMDQAFVNGLSGHFREGLFESISIYGGKKMTLSEIRKDWQTRLKGQKRYYVPEEEGRKFKTAPGVYRNVSDSFPATARKANRQFDHNGLTLTPRQLARVQGVPDEFKLYIDTERRNYWINKARTPVTKTPPYEISYWFKRKLEKCKHLWKN
jgi:site-specific DNA-cytosine methylase